MEIKERRITPGQMPVDWKKKEEVDNVNHPAHYTAGDAKCISCNHPIECIDVVSHMSFRLGNIIKYLWRAGRKNGLEDLKKAAWYLNHLIERGGK